MLAGAMGLVTPISQAREERQLNWSAASGEGLPPDLAVTGAALGTFRGIAVNLMWYRAMDLRDSGQFHEAMQLSRWITRLQPRFPRVWEFNAWNMAYNISAATHTSEERWLWVRAGIRLLRDEGIPTNPESLVLHRELAWIFLHKIGEYTDASNGYYKLQLARQWHALLGEPPAGDFDAYLDWLGRLARAPRELEELVGKHPALEPSVAGRSLRTPEDAAAWLHELATATERSERTGDPEVHEPRAALETSAREALRAFLQARVLRERHRMEPASMVELAKNAGPLDWRHSAAHAAYWAFVGRQRNRASLSAVAENEFSAADADRLLFFALRKLTQEGRVTFDPTASYFSTLPDSRFLPFLEKTLFAVYEAAGRAGSREFQTRHQEFLDLATRVAFIYGERAEALRWYERAGSLYGDPEDPEDWYSRPLEQYLQEEFQRTIGRPEDAKQFIAGRIHQGLIEGLANGRPRVADRLFREAREMRGWFLTHWVESDTRLDELGIGTFAETFRDVVLQLLRGDEVPREVKRRVWRNLPEDSRSRLREDVPEAVRQ